MSAQPWSEGHVQESEVIFYSRMTKTYVYYRSTVDGNIYEATFEGVAVVLRKDLIKITLPPGAAPLAGVAPTVVAQPFVETTEWSELRQHILEKYKIDINTADSRLAHPVQVLFFLKLKAALSVKADTIEDTTQAITYTH